jgi:hypothetical protein
MLALGFATISALLGASHAFCGIVDATDGQTVRGVVISYGGEKPFGNSLGGVSAYVREEGTNKKVAVYQDDASCVLIRRCEHSGPKRVESLCCESELAKPPAMHQGDTVEVTQHMTWTGRREWSVRIVIRADPPSTVADGGANKPVETATAGTVLKFATPPTTGKLKAQ